MNIKLMKLRILLVPILGLSAISANAEDSRAAFYDKYFPDGVRIGITPEQLQSHRSKAFESPFRFSREENVLELIEAPEHGDVPLAYLYRFKDQQLRAIARSLSARDVPEAHVRSAASTMYNDLQSGFVSKGQEEIIRFNGGPDTLLTASVWEDPRSRTLIYFVASNDELTLTAFDPSAFQKDDFFLGPERLKDFQSSSQPSSESTSTAASTPRPLIDLQPKIRAEAATSPTADAIGAAK